MALIAERWGLIPDLREFSAKGNPVWGTCAGLIFLADRATGQLTMIFISKTFVYGAAG